MTTPDTLASLIAQMANDYDCHYWGQQLQSALYALAEKWEKEFPLSDDMDHCYAIHANAVWACAAELRGRGESET